MPTPMPPLIAADLHNHRPEPAIKAPNPCETSRPGADGDDQAGIRYFGDGVIVSTPSGSTAYSVSAGGPILSPNVDGLCITPLCPHSLSSRPVVISSQSVINVVAKRVNAGTTLICDGQATTKLSTG